MSYREGFNDGWRAGIEYAMTFNPESSVFSPMKSGESMPLPKKKPKRRKSKKVRILDEMSKKAWDKYKKGSGKKTYVQIRAQVSRSVTYKKRVKNL